MQTLEEITAALQQKVGVPIEHYGFFMTKGSFSKAPAGAIGDVGKIVGGILRKKKGGDLTGVSAGRSAMGMDNHQTALVLAAGNLYAVDMTTSMGGDRDFGDVLGIWPADEIVVEGTRKGRGTVQGYETVQLNLDITHPPSGQGGKLETMGYEGMGDPSVLFYEVITALG